MAFGGFNSRATSAPMAEINTTPLVDVMLVLLIIFIITAPLMTHSVAVDLPRVSSRPTPEKPMKLTVAIDAQGQVFIGAEAIGRDQLEARFRAAVVSDAGVEMHFQADRNTRYEIIAETMGAARRAGVSKIGFVTQAAEARR